MQRAPKTTSLKTQEETNIVIIKPGFYFLTPNLDTFLGQGSSSFTINLFGAV